MSERTIAEIIGWTASRNAYGRLDGSWVHPDGRFSCNRPAPDVDDMLAWLSQHPTFAYQSSWEEPISITVDDEVCLVLTDQDGDTEPFYAPTLKAALEAAVRAVAGAAVAQEAEHRAQEPNCDRSSVLKGDREND